MTGLAWPNGSLDIQRQSAGPNPPLGPRKETRWVQQQHSELWVPEQLLPVKTSLLFSLFSLALLFLDPDLNLCLGILLLRPLCGSHFCCWTCGDMRWWLVGASLWLVLALALSDIQARSNAHGHGCRAHRGKRKRNGFGKSAFKKKTADFCPGVSTRYRLFLGLGSLQVSLTLCF